MRRAATRRFEAVHTNSKVVAVSAAGEGFHVEIDGEGGRGRLEADRVLVAVGRRPNTDDLGLAEIGVILDERGRIAVDERGASNLPGIWAIGDVTPGPMLAHKASREAKVVAEAIAEHPSAFDNRAIPAVVFTEPELAWAGLTEDEAEKAKRPVRIGRFPLKALGRARTLGRTEGMVKLIADPDTGLLLGGGMVGPGASEHVAEITLALEMGATLEDLVVTIHPPSHHLGSHRRSRRSGRGLERPRGAAEGTDPVILPYDEDERLLARARRIGRPLVTVTRPAGPAVILGRASRPERELHLDALRHDGIALLRRGGGGCAVFVDEGTVLLQARLPRSRHRRSARALPTLHGLGGEPPGRSRPGRPLHRGSLRPRAGRPQGGRRVHDPTKGLGTLRTEPSGRHGSCPHGTISPPSPPANRATVADDRTRTSSSASGGRGRSPTRQIWQRACDGS